MKVNVSCDLLVECLEYAISVIERKNAIPILANVKFVADSESNTVTITATDMDISVTSVVDADVEQGGVTTLPARTLYTIVKKIDSHSDVIINQSDDEASVVTVSSKDSEFNLPVISAEQFPNFELIEENVKFNVNALAFRTILQKTQHAISLEETRYYLNGIYLHKEEAEQGDFLRAVATDCHRLAKSEILLPSGAENLEGIIIPQKAVVQIIKLLDGFAGDINVGVSNNRIRLNVGNHKLITRLVDAKYPDYKKAIPENNDKSLTISTAELAKAVDLVSSIAFDKGRTINLNFRNSQLVLTASNDVNQNTSGKQELSANYNYDPVTMHFNAKYIMDSLEAIEGDEVKLLFTNNTAGMLAMDTKNSNNLYLLMPVQN